MKVTKRHMGSIGTEFAAIWVLSLIINKMDVTKDFQTFVDSICDLNYHEIYELYQAASGNQESVTLYRVEPAKGSNDVLIIHDPSDSALRLTPKAKDYFPEWIESNLMGGLDAESFYSMKYAMERDSE